MITMITEVGIVSGKILTLLEEQDRPLSVAEIKSHLDNSMAVINMSIGWLAREKHVHIIIKENKNYLFPIPKERFSPNVAESLECISHV